MWKMWRLLFCPDNLNNQTDQGSTISYRYNYNLSIFKYCPCHNALSSTILAPFPISGTSGQVIFLNALRLRNTQALSKIHIFAFVLAGEIIIIYKMIIIKYNFDKR